MLPEGLVPASAGGQGLTPRATTDRERLAAERARTKGLAEECDRLRGLLGSAEDSLREVNELTEALQASEEGRQTALAALRLAEAEAAEAATEAARWRDRAEAAEEDKDAAVAAAVASLEAEGKEERRRRREAEDAAAAAAAERDRLRADAEGAMRALTAELAATTEAAGEAAERA